MTANTTIKDGAATAARAGACCGYLQANSQEPTSCSTCLSAIAMLILAGELQQP